MPLDLNPWFVITTIGDPRLWIALCSIIFFIRMFYKGKIEPHNKKFLWAKLFIVFAGFSMASALGVSQILKVYFQIPRVCSPETNVYCMDGFSFPSGHTAVAFAVFTGLYIILNKRKYIWVFAVPVLVAISRLALGVHTVYDVVAGASLGLVTALIYYLAITKIQPLRAVVYGGRKSLR